MAQCVFNKELINKTTVFSFFVIKPYPKYLSKMFLCYFPYLKFGKNVVYTNKSVSPKKDRVSLKMR